MKPLCLVKTGSTVPGVRARRGDFEDWIQAASAARGVEWQLVDVQQDAPLPSPEAVSGVVVTGSSAMVSHREPWSERAARWLGSAARADIPILAICYGHQLLAHGLGGEVGPNPRGREIGTVEVSLRPEALRDPLFEGLPQRLPANASHVESVLRLPPGAVRLAENPADPHHAFRVGRHAWGVQFHPEFDADVMRGYLEERRQVLASEGLDAEALQAAARDTPAAAGLLDRFVGLVQRWFGGDG
ncbi:MAG: glutamine amidotransferase [Proteobacteria bacterium]|nr:glutamine amidotransferase [Pseudomonadota bacterium]